MKDEAGALLTLYAETPLHAGSGSGLGAVDLPIQRERMTHLPMMQGSGLKGALYHEIHRGLDDHAREALFGPRPGNENDPIDYAGALSLTDARLLLFPVRTVWGGWAWLTSHMILERLVRDLETLQLSVLAGEARSLVAALGEETRDGDARVGTSSQVAPKDELWIEDYAYRVLPLESVAELARWIALTLLPQDEVYKPFRDRLPGQLAIMSDGELRRLCKEATEVVTRIRINEETGTVASGALWSEEHLPAESVLWSAVFVAGDRRPKERRKKDGEKEPSSLLDSGTLLARLSEAIKQRSRIRLGGDRTVGRGIAAVCLVDYGKEDSHG